MIITPGFVGIDISKHHLDVFDGALGRGERFANEAADAVALAARFAAQGSFVTFEATGHYDLALRLALEKAEVPHARVNPARSRAFAKAAGVLAKTDTVDARMLAAMGQCLTLPEHPPAPAECRRLALLHKRRDQLVAMRTQEKTRRHDHPDADLLADIHRHLAWLDTEIAGIDRRIAGLIAEHADLERRGRLMRSVPGIGPVNAATLLALAPELGARSPKAIAALAGLAPFNQDSGQQQGPRAIRGGRKRLRDALYIAALGAAKTTTRLGAFYRALRRAGKPPKLALIALARKIITILNAVIRDNKAFQP